MPHFEVWDWVRWGALLHKAIMVEYPFDMIITTDWLNERLHESQCSFTLETCLEFSANNGTAQ